MGSYYTVKDKVKALQALDENNGEVVLTAKELHIPERTLRDWVEFREEVMNAFLDEKARRAYKGWSPFWKDRQEYVRPPESMYPKKLEEVDDDDITKQLMAVREHLMKGVVRLSERIAEGDEQIVERAMALSRLVDRVKVLDQQIIDWRTVNSSGTLLIEYVHEDGMVYDRPMYALGDGADPEEPMDDDVIPDDRFEQARMLIERERSENLNE